MRRRSGGYTIEFVLLLPVWIVMIFGALDIGWLMLHAGAIRSAGALSCASTAMLDPGETGLSMPALLTRAETSLTQELAVLGVSIPAKTVSLNLSGVAPLRRLSCTVTADVASLTRVVLFSRSITRTSSAQLQWQQSEVP